MRTSTSLNRCVRSSVCLFVSILAPAAFSMQGAVEATRVRTLTAEQVEILQHLSIVYLDDGQGGTVKTLDISGINVRIHNGLGATNGYPTDPFSTNPQLTQTNGLGNLIVGYNEASLTAQNPANRTGSHNIAFGFGANFSSFGGLVGGRDNHTSGAFATITGGSRNEAVALLSTVSGGVRNTATGHYTSVGGGRSNIASGGSASISGGTSGLASGYGAAISGGYYNRAVGGNSSVTGGNYNTAGDPTGVCIGLGATVSGGISNGASGCGATVSGGYHNNAGGEHASVSGGVLRSANSSGSWSAGELSQAN